MFVAAWRSQVEHHQCRRSTEPEHALLAAPSAAGQLPVHVDGSRLSAQLLGALEKDSEYSRRQAPSATSAASPPPPPPAATQQQAASSKQQAASSKQQAASSKQQAASSKQQAASSKQQAASSSSIKSSGHHQLWLCLGFIISSSIMRPFAEDGPPAVDAGVNGTESVLWARRWPSALD
jgi:type IV secretory pathway VirB10-like protein